MDEQQQIVELVQRALQGDPQATLQIQSIIQAAQSGNLKAVQLALLIQLIAQEMQASGQIGNQGSAPQGASMMRNGGILDYMKYLRGKCPEGYEMLMFRKGGAICKKCIKKKAQGDSINMERPTNVIDEFRCGRKMKMKKKACGGELKRK